MLKPPYRASEHLFICPLEPKAPGYKGAAQIPDGPWPHGEFDKYKRGANMFRPSTISVATAVFIAGLCNAFAYTFGYLAIAILYYIRGISTDGTFASFLSSTIVTLIFTMLLSSIITFVLAFPIAMVCRTFRCTGIKAFVIAPAVGAIIACAIASLLQVEWSTDVAIVAFAYISSAIMWLVFDRPGAAQGARLPDGSAGQAAA